VKRRQPEVKRHTSMEPSATVREAPSTGHVAIVGHDGTELGPDDLFTDPAPHSSTVVTQRRILQKFRYPGTETVTTQLVYAAGVRVPREHAARLTATVRSSQPAEASTPAEAPSG
jgi:hypothetical protein